MQVQDIMTAQVTSCTPDATLHEVAQKMVDSDCGAIPIVDPQTRKAIGIVTDRDIVCRAVAKGQNPASLRAQDVMTTPITAVRLDTSVEKCLTEMEAAHVRRMLVIDGSGALRGVVAQADVALKAPERDTGALVKDLSQPTVHSSNVQ